MFKLRKLQRCSLKHGYEQERRKVPREVADFYCALYDALEQGNITKAEEAQAKLLKS